MRSRLLVVLAIATGFLLGAAAGAVGYAKAGLAGVPLAVAIVGALLAPGPPPAPPTIAAVPGPINVQSPSDETVATSGDAGATLLKESTQPAHVKVVSSEEQPIDLAQAPGDLSPAEAFVPAAADAAEARAGGGVGRHEQRRLSESPRQAVEVCRNNVHSDGRAAGLSTSK